MAESRGQDALSVLKTCLILLVLLSTTGLAVRKGYAIATPPAAPSWLTAGDYIQYNLTYTIGELTASINVKDTVITNNGVADVHIEMFGPQIPNGFPEPGLVAPFDSGNQRVTTVITSSNSTTTIIGGSGFTTDLTMFVSQAWLAGLNATLQSVHVIDSRGATAQAWRVDENALYRFIGGATALPGEPLNPSLVWFEKDTLMKVRESTNYTDPNNNYIVSIETLEGTNIPQLEAALTGQELSSTQSTSALSSSTSTGTAQSPSYPTDWAALVAVVVVTILAVAFYFIRGRNFPYSLERQLS
jgi:hypothetical protein